MTAAAARASAPRARSLRRVWTFPRVRPELLGLLALALVLDLWALRQNGWANEYYSAAVRSMSSSWHNFLYDSFDPSGVMTVDKPPLALWVQALSVRVFGFHPLSMLVPQALMGAGSVALVYDLTRRPFGRAAGFAAGVVLALTPTAVAISRHNNPDAMLILCCTAALWFVVRGLEDGRTRWIVLSGVAVGLGFEAKMGVALMVVPGIAAAWLWSARRGAFAAVRQLLAGGAAMAAVGGAWPLLMALTPAADRPWISGTSDNSIVSLILQYNGFGRLDGQAGGPRSFGNGGPFGGSPGVLRLLDSSYGGQAGWLLGFALVSAIGVAVASRMRRSDARTGWVLAVGGAFLVSAVAFSEAKGITHPYYISFLAPFSATLAGGGVAEIVRGGLTARLLAPLAIAAGVISELIVIHNVGGFGWLVPLLAAVGIAMAFALAGVPPRRTRVALTATAVGVLLLAPASWAVQTLGHATNGTFPAGGPATVAFGGPGGPGGLPGGPPPGGGAPPGGPAAGGFGGDGASLSSIASYVQAHGGGTVGVSSQMQASSEVIASRLSVAGLGGFSGRESEVSVKWLAGAVQSGRVRWVLVSAEGNGPGPGRDRRIGASKLMAAVAKTCRPALTTTAGTLYDCSGHAAALSAGAG